MYGQLLELIFLAGLALILFNRLISNLGVNDEQNLEHKNVIKDVTNTTKVVDVNFDYSIVSHPNKYKNVTEGIAKIQENIPNFNPTSFLHKSRKAADMIIKASAYNEKEALLELVDKRFVEEAISTVSAYKVDFFDNFESKISNISSFGNSIFIEIVWKSKTDDNFIEESWTFSRNFSSESPAWLLVNIEKDKNS